MISIKASEGKSANSINMEPKFIRTYILSKPTASKLMFIGSLGVICACSSTKLSIGMRSKLAIYIRNPKKILQIAKFINYLHAKTS